MSPMIDFPDLALTMSTNRSILHTKYGFLQLIKFVIPKTKEGMKMPSKNIWIAFKFLIFSYS